MTFADQHSHEARTLTHMPTSATQPRTQQQNVTEIHKKQTTISVHTLNIKDNMMRESCCLLLAYWALVCMGASAFSVTSNSIAQGRRGASFLSMAGQGFAPPPAEKQRANDISSLTTLQIKDKLLKLLPSMLGTNEDFALVEQYVNALEDAYVPVQTLDFFNLAMTGEWQLLFSTNISNSGPKPNFRLRELLQTVESNGLQGQVTNVATWDLAHDGTTFDATGTFSVKCPYTINQGARMILELQDHVLEPSKGSAIPSDVPALVGMLHRNMPKELFDPNDHAMDTTYLDGDLRIVRMTGGKFEGVRDIFVRKGSFLIDPTPPSQ